jgi:hypothetical protein
MAIDLSALFGQQPDYSAFLPNAEVDRMRANASQQALLNSAIAALSMTGRTREPISTGQVLAGMLGAGSEGYNQAFDRTLKQMVTGMQLEDFKRKRQAQEMARQAFKQEPVPIPMATGEGSQLAMLADPMFGGDMPGVRGQDRAITETAATLRANLPTKTTLDMDKLIQAIAVTDPIEAAKLAQPKENKLPPGKVGEYVAAQNAGIIPKSMSFDEFAKIGKEPLVKNIVGTAETEYSKFVGKAGGERDVATYDAAQRAVNNLPKINDTLMQIQQSDAITGLGSEVFKNIERVKTTFTADKKAGKKVSDTEYLDALLGSDIFPMISSLGIGAKGLDTPAEREFLRQVMTGTTSMNKETLVKLTKMRKDIEERAINRYNEKVEKGELDRFFSAAGIQKNKISVPRSITVNY